MNHRAPITPARPGTSSRFEPPAKRVDDFDIVKEQTPLNYVPEAGGVHISGGVSTLEAEAAATDLEIPYAVSISMPPSPSKAQTQHHNEQLSYNKNTPKSHDSPISSSSSPRIPETSYSQPIPRSMTGLPMRNPALDKLKNGRFNSFKTRSGKFERQMSSLRGGWTRETLEDSNTVQNKEVENLPVARYFDALQGPELDRLKQPSEELLLPKDEKWPFLLRFQISSFGICLGLSSQAIMWKSLATSTSTNFLQISLNINLVLWCISLASVAIVSAFYLLKMVFYFEAVRREYYHPVRVNFFFAPWITFLFLVLGAPPKFSQHLHVVLWYVLMAPIFCLEVKFYGQWMSGGQRRLSKVANPSNHLSVVGNFVGSLVGASMGLKEVPLFFFAVGLAHYVVLFVTLYQRLPTNETLPKDLHPVFFLFVAAPSVASMAWAVIQGSFDYGSRIAYFIAMFLYFSLAVRINFFRGFRFSLAWWVYTFPMTGAAIATINYSNVVTNTFTKSLTVALCAIAFFTVIALLLTTIVHAFVLKDLFPNDVAVAISERRPSSSSSSTGRWQIPGGGGGSSNNKDIEHYLKFANGEERDVEAPSEPSILATKGDRVSGQNDDSSIQR